MRRLAALKRLLLHTVVVDDKDYSAILELPLLEKVRVMAVPGMVPSIDELRTTLPWDH